MLAVRDIHLFVTLIMVDEVWIFVFKCLQFWSLGKNNITSNVRKHSTKFTLPICDLSCMVQSVYMLKLIYLDINSWIQFVKGTELNTLLSLEDTNLLSFLPWKWLSKSACVVFCYCYCYYDCYYCCRHRHHSFVICCLFGKMKKLMVAILHRTFSGVRPLAQELFFFFFPLAHDMIRGCTLLEFTVNLNI